MSISFKIIMTYGLSLLKKSSIYAIGNLGSKFLSYFLVLLYTHYISPKDMGYYDLVLTTITLLQPIVLCQINDGVYRYLINNSKHDAVKYLNVGLSILLINVLISISVLVALNCLCPIINIEILFILLISSCFCTFFQDVVRAFGFSSLYARIGVFNSFMLLSIEIIGLVLLEYGIMALFIGKIIANISSVLLIILLKMDIFKNLSIQWSREIAYSLLSYSLPLIPNTISWWIVNFFNRFIIMSCLNTAYNGVFAISNKFPTIVTTLTSIFYLAWQEIAIKHYDNDLKDNTFSIIFCKYYTLLLLACTCLVPFSKIVSVYFFAIDYSDAWKYSSILLLGAFFSSLSAFLGVGYQISKETYRSFKSTILAAFINIFFNIVLVSDFGLYGICVSSVLSYLLLFIIRLKHTKKYFSINIDIKDFSLHLFIYIFILLISYYANGFKELFLLLLMCLGFGLYRNKNFIISLKNKST